MTRSMEHGNKKPGHLTGLVQRGFDVDLCLLLSVGKEV